MCRELSAVFTFAGGNLRMYRSPDTDSHQDVLELHGLVRGEDRCACVEYVCADYTRAHEPGAWKLILDDERAPSWWNEQRDAVLAQMDRLRGGLTIREDRLIIVGGGPYILAPGVHVGRMVRARILTMCERARVGNDSTLTGGHDSTLTGGDSSTLTGGDRSTLTGGAYSKLTGGDDSTLTGGVHSKLTGGVHSILTGGSYSTLTGGSYSTLTGDSYSKLTGGDGSKLTGGDGSILCTDHGDHMHDARVGRDGILPGHAYTVREETWVLR